MKRAAVLLALGLGLAAGGAENLAAGKTVFYSIPPDNPADTVPSKLTDGQKNTRRAVGKSSGESATSFDEQRQDYADTMDNKLTAGWHFKGYGHETAGIRMCLDLEKVQTLGKSIVRAGSFRKSMYRFSLPRAFELAISRDGQHFYHAGTVKKITTEGYANLKPGEQPLKISEGDNRWIEIEFDLSGLEARYVGLTVKPEGFMFYLDEWEVFSGTATDAEKLAAVYAAPNRARFAVGNGLADADAVAFGPAHDTFFVPANTFVPAFFYFSDNRKEKPKREKLEYVMDLPKGIELHRSFLLTNQFEVTETDRGTYNRIVLVPRPTGKHFQRYHGKMIGGATIGPFYFRPKGEIATDAQAAFFCRSGETEFTPYSLPVRILEFPAVDNQLPAAASITWMTDYYVMDWPDFFESYSGLGFNAVPYFPRLWPSIAELPEKNYEPEQHIARARGAGLKIIQNESPLHTMKNLGKTACTYEGAKGFCPTYRGEYYQEHLKELAENSRIIQPDFLIWDIELMHRSIGGNPENIMKCERCAAAVKESGKTAQEYLFDCGTAIQRDLYENAAAVIKHKFAVGQYDVYAGQPQYQRIFRFASAYPEYLQISMPAAYTAGLFDVNHRIAQREYNLLKEKWRSWTWTTPGTYGYCASHKMEALVYEQLLNGGSVCIYSFNEFVSPDQLYYLAKGLRTLSAFPALFRGGAPDTAFKADNPRLFYSKFTDGRETLVFAANYTSPEYEEFTLQLPGEATRLDRNEKLPAGKQRIKLGPAEFALFHYLQ